MALHCSFTSITKSCHIHLTIHCVDGGVERMRLGLWLHQMALVQALNLKAQSARFYQSPSNTASCDGCSNAGVCSILWEVTQPPTCYQCCNSTKQ